MDKLGKYPSRWVAVARTRRRPRPRGGRRRAGARCESNAGQRAWTDDYANVTAVLHLG